MASTDTFSLYDNMVQLQTHEGFELAVQVYTNAIVLSSVVAQIVVLLTFAQDFTQYPLTVRVLSLTTLTCSIISPTVVFISFSTACHPGIAISCHFYFAGIAAKWCTYVLRLWALSNKSVAVAVSMTSFVVLSSTSFEGYCFNTVGVRPLPILCAPSLTPQGSVFAPLSQALIVTQLLVFIALHVRYLYKFSATTRLLRAGARISRSSSIAPSTRLHVTIRLFGKSTVLMLVDASQFALRSVVESRVTYFFTLVYGAQIIHDLIYCSYMRAFANDLRQLGDEEQDQNEPEVVIEAGNPPPLPPTAMRNTMKLPEQAHISRSHPNPGAGAIV